MTAFFTPPTVQNGGRGAEGHQRYRLMRKGGIYGKQNFNSPLFKLRTDGSVFGRSARQADCDSRSDCYGMDYEFEDIGSLQ